MTGLPVVLSLRMRELLTLGSLPILQDLQDGKIEITKNDCLANVPYVEGCGLWFDHHSSEHERLKLKGKYEGESRLAPSCARIIYEYYGGRERFSHYDDLMQAVDKVDSGNLTIDENTKIPRTGF